MILCGGDLAVVNGNVVVVATLVLRVRDLGETGDSGRAFVCSACVDDNVKSLDLSLLPAHWHDLFGRDVSKTVMAMSCLRANERAGSPGLTRAPNVWLNQSDDYPPARPPRHDESLTFERFASLIGAPSDSLNRALDQVRSSGFARADSASIVDFIAACLLVESPSVQAAVAAAPRAHRPAPEDVERVVFEAFFVLFLHSDGAQRLNTWRRLSLALKIEVASQLALLAARHSLMLDVSRFLANHLESFGDCDGADYASVLSKKCSAAKETDHVRFFLLCGAPLLAYTALLADFAIDVLSSSDHDLRRLSIYASVDRRFNEVAFEQAVARQHAALPNGNRVSKAVDWRMRIAFLRHRAHGFMTGTTDRKIAYNSHLCGNEHIDSPACIAALAEMARLLEPDRRCNAVTRMFGPPKLQCVACRRVRRKTRMVVWARRAMDNVRAGEPLEPSVYHRFRKACTLDSTQNDGSEDFDRELFFVALSEEWMMEEDKAIKDIIMASADSELSAHLLAQQIEVMVAGADEVVDVYSLASRKYRIVHPYSGGALTDDDDDDVECDSIAVALADSLGDAGTPAAGTRNAPILIDDSDDGENNSVGAGGLSASAFASSATGGGAGGLSASTLGSSATVASALASSATGGGAGGGGGLSASALASSAAGGGAGGLSASTLGSSATVASALASSATGASTLGSSATGASALASSATGGGAGGGGGLSASALASSAAGGGAGGLSASALASSATVASALASSATGASALASSATGASALASSATGGGAGGGCGLSASALAGGTPMTIDDDLDLPGDMAPLVVGSVDSGRHSNVATSLARAAFDPALRSSILSVFNARSSATGGGDVRDEAAVRSGGFVDESSCAGNERMRKRGLSDCASAKRTRTGGGDDSDDDDCGGGVVNRAPVDEADVDTRVPVAEDTVVCGKRSGVELDSAADKRARHVVDDADAATTAAVVASTVTVTGAVDLGVYHRRLTALYQCAGADERDLILRCVGRGTRELLVSADQIADHFVTLKLNKVSISVDDDALARAGAVLVKPAIAGARGVLTDGAKALVDGIKALNPAPARPVNARAVPRRIDSIEIDVGKLGLLAARRRADDVWYWAAHRESAVVRLAERLRQGRDEFGANWVPLVAIYVRTSDVNPEGHQLAAHYGPVREAIAFASARAGVPVHVCVVGESGSLMEFDWTTRIALHDVAAMMRSRRKGILIAVEAGRLCRSCDDVDSMNHGLLTLAEQCGWLVCALIAAVGRDALERCRDDLLRSCAPERIESFDAQLASALREQLAAAAQPTDCTITVRLMAILCEAATEAQAPYTASHGLLRRTLLHMTSVLCGFTSVGGAPFEEWCEHSCACAAAMAPEQSTVYVVARTSIERGPEAQRGCESATAAVTALGYVLRKLPQRKLERRVLYGLEGGSVGPDAAAAALARSGGLVAAASMDRVTRDTDEVERLVREKARVLLCMTPRSSFVALCALAKRLECDLVDVFAPSLRDAARSRYNEWLTALRAQVESCGAGMNAILPVPCELTAVNCRVFVAFTARESAAFRAVFPLTGSIRNLYDPGVFEESAKLGEIVRAIELYRGSPSGQVRVLGRGRVTVDDVSLKSFAPPPPRWSQQQQRAAVVVSICPPPPPLPLCVVVGNDQQLLNVAGHRNLTDEVHSSTCRSRTCIKRDACVYRTGGTDVSTMRCAVLQLHKCTTCESAFKAVIDKSKVYRDQADAAALLTVGGDAVGDVVAAVRRAVRPAVVRPAVVRAGGGGRAPVVPRANAYFLCGTSKLDAAFNKMQDVWGADLPGGKLSPGEMELAMEMLKGYWGDEEYGADTPESERAPVVPRANAYFLCGTSKLDAAFNKMQDVWGADLPGGKLSPGEMELAMEMLKGYWGDEEYGADTPESEVRAPEPLKPENLPAPDHPCYAAAECEPGMLRCYATGGSFSGISVTRVGRRRGGTCSLTNVRGVGCHSKTRAVREIFYQNCRIFFHTPTPGAFGMTREKLDELMNNI
jgi:hypothetical protein